jgi:hypothetical protein
MHPDPMPAPEPVIHVTQTPKFVKQADGTVRAYYPAEDWHVVGTDQTDATKKLIDESERRMQDPAYFTAHFALAQQHLNGDAVTPGFEVDTLTAEQYEQRTTELGEQLRHQ